MNPNEKNRRDVWRVNAGRKSAKHPVRMPVALAEICIKAGSQEGDIVLDPFAGSGTTGIAALGLGRRFVGIELIDRFGADATERLRQSVLGVESGTA